MIGVQCEKMIMIDEHIPKHPVNNSKVKRCVESRKKDESPRGESMTNSSSEKNKLK